MDESSDAPLAHAFGGGPGSASAGRAGSASTDALTRLLGGKGAGLALMSRIGLPVPPGFTLSTFAARGFLADGWSPGLEDAIVTGLRDLEGVTGKALGHGEHPLLVSVRSGAEVSMPGMMDSVLNVGMSSVVEQALANLTGDPAFAADTHLRALISFAQTVQGAPQDVIAAMRRASSPSDAAALLAAAGFTVPAEPRQQVLAAVRSVFESWNTDRARRYREIEGIDHGLGTAATVQAMVFGNLGPDSGTGVAFTRHPSTGHKGLMGDFMACAQGEDVVAGDHVTQPLVEMSGRWPAAWAELERIATVLESHYADMVDIEFTVERGTLWMLQARRGKRSPIAMFRMAIDMAEDPGFPVDRAEAVRRCEPFFDDPPQLDLTPESGGGDLLEVIATGIGASPGRGSGVLCMDVDEAVRLGAAGVDVVLARRETSPGDVYGMAAAKGLITTLGGIVSHAAVVARSWGLPAVVGAAGVTLTADALVGPGGRVEQGEIVTVDGASGQLLRGAKVTATQVAPEVTTAQGWAAALSGRDPQAENRPAVAESEVPFEVLHALRIKGMATAETLAGMVDGDPTPLEAVLRSLVEADLAQHIEARDLWAITNDGRAAHHHSLQQALEGIDLRDLRYEEFLALNTGFKQLCTDWQVRDGEPNDHTDAGYDAGIIARLVEHDDKALDVVGSMGAVLVWTAPYPARLSAARRRVEAGDPKGLTGVMCDSYHDIWMELHEDLILAQGIDRAAEGST